MTEEQLTAEIQRLKDEAKRANTSLDQQIQEGIAVVAAHTKDMQEKDAAHTEAMQKKDVAHAKAMQEKDAAHAKAIADIEEKNKSDLEAQEKRILSEHPAIAAKREKLKALAEKQKAEREAAEKEIISSLVG